MAEGEGSRSKGKAKTRIDEYLEEETNMDPSILFKHIRVNEEIEEARRQLVQSQQKEEAIIVEIETNNNNHVVDSMEAAEGLEIFLEARPGWSGTIEVKPSKEEEYDDRIEKLAEKYRGVINFEWKY